jgi:DNA-binding transcriptional LysR family regulator
MASLPNMILEGRFDLGYIRCPLSLPDGIEGVRLSDEGFVLALPADSWLNRLTVINSAHLQNENFILPNKSLAPCRRPLRAILCRSWGRSRVGWWR